MKKANESVKKDDTQFQFLNAILSGKQHMDASDYSPIFGNLGLSQHPDCILYANEMNRLPNLSPQQQFDYLFNAIPKIRRKFGKWAKRKDIKDKDIELISRYFVVNYKVAAMYLNLLSEEQVEQIRKDMDPGGPV